jgi:hypothetical protein
MDAMIKRLGILIMGIVASAILTTIVGADDVCPPPPPSPPALNNPQDPIIYGADPTGVNDSLPAFKSALAVGDLDIHAGTYKLLPTVGVTGYTPPSGRNVYCENPHDGSLPTPSSPVVLSVPVAPTGGYDVFYQWASGTLYGCEVEGYHYPNTTWTGDTNASAGDSFVRELQFGHDFNAYNNGFDGWPGSVGVFTINAANLTSYNAGQWPYNINISYNRFSNCNVRGVEIDFGKNVQITHNTYVDCSQTSEIQNWHYTGMTALTDSNSFTFIVGSKGGSTSIFDNRASSGDVCISGVTGAGDCGSSCTASCPSDYSGNTFSNNTVFTQPPSSNQSNIFENVQQAGAANPAVYRDNACGRNCVQQYPPGNPNANSWGLGSNQ